MFEILNVFVEFTQSYGYLGIFILMIIESSFIPYPSEAVIIPAAFLAYSGELNLGLIVLFGVFGSIVGALINYFLSLKLGRPIVYKLIETKWAKFLLLNKKNLEKAEDLFLRFDKSSTFFGRLIPAVRQLISIPAGFTKMPLFSFVLYTTLGASLWLTILAYLGYFLANNQALLYSYESFINRGMILLFFVFVVYIYFKVRRKKLVFVTEENSE